MQYARELLEVFQSTPSQEGERRRGSKIIQTLAISIHSLARGRTAFLCKVDEFKVISIHSLARGRTRLCMPFIPQLLHFNPLPRKRENSAFNCPIHKPKNFNPLPRKRENLGVQLPNPQTQKFQSTPSQEGERYSTAKLIIHIAISIHSLARGRTNLTIRVYKGKKISIHSLARGRTLP